jgi:hypothetical protein
MKQEHMLAVAWDDVGFNGLRLANFACKLVCGNQWNDSDSRGARRNEDRAFLFELNARRAANSIELNLGPGACERHHGIARRRQPQLSKSARDNHASEKGHAAACALLPTKSLLLAEHLVVSSLRPLTMNGGDLAIVRIIQKDVCEAEPCDLRGTRNALVKHRVKQRKDSEVKSLEPPLSRACNSRR